MIELSVGVMVIALIYRSAYCTHERLYASGIFVGASLAHLFFVDALSELGGLYPYLGASIFDLAIVSIISKIKIVVPTTIYLYRICLAEIFLNFIGWIMWDHNVSNYDTIYQGAFSVLSVYTVYILFRKDEADDKRGVRNDSWGYLLRSVISPRGSFVKRSGE